MSPRQRALVTGVVGPMLRVDSDAMEPRDRLAALGLLVAAAVAWLIVAVLLTSRDPVDDPDARVAGALAIGLALGLTAAPLFWLAGFARQRRIVYAGDWTRALRRGGWVGAAAAIIVLLRVEGVLQLPIALFVVALVVVAEVAISGRR